MTQPQDQKLSEVVDREQSRLRAFIRRRVSDPGDAEDILQEVWFELVEATRLMMPIDHVTGWLFRVARNRIIDGFRRRRPERTLPLDHEGSEHGPDGAEAWRSSDDGPEEHLVRQWLLEEMEAAIEELPADQRAVFVAHELEGKSFKQLSEETGVSVNTLLSRKHYAVVRLRERLQSIHDEIEEE